MSEPVAARPQVLSNLGWLAFGRFFGDLATFLLLVAVSRAYGEEGLGLYAFAMALAIIYVTLSDLGLYMMFIREAGSGREPLPVFFGQVFTLGGGLAILAGLALLVSDVVLPFAPATEAVVLVVGVYQLLYKRTELCAAAFMVAGQTHVGSWLEIASKVLSALLAGALIWGGASLPVALLVLPAVTLVQLLLGYRLIVRRLGRPRLAWHPAALLATLRRTRHYAVSALQMPIFARADVLLLGVLAGTAATGVYSAAYRVVFLLNVVANLAPIALLPVVSRLWVSARGAAAETYHTTLRLAVLVTLPAACGLWLIAPRLIEAIFGPDFGESATVLRLLCWLLILFPLRALLGMFLTASDQQAARARFDWTGAAVVWGGGLVLIPLAGEVGAALAVLLAEGVMAALALARLVPLWGWPAVGSRLATSAFGIAAFALPALLWPELPLAVIVPAAIGLYGGTLALSSDIRATEYRMLRALLAGRQP